MNTGLPLTRADARCAAPRPRCAKEKDPEDPACQKYAHYYRSICPTEWVRCAPRRARAAAPRCHRRMLRDCSCGAYAACCVRMRRTGARCAAAGGVRLRHFCGPDPARRHAAGGPLERAARERQLAGPLLSAQRSPLACERAPAAARCRPPLQAWRARLGEGAPPQPSADAAGRPTLE